MIDFIPPTNPPIMLLIGIDQLKMITESKFGVFGSSKTSFYPTEAIFDLKNITELD